ncbi:hypothetical protein [Methanocaldococcus sp.]
MSVSVVIEKSAEGPIFESEKEHNNENIKNTIEQLDNYVIEKEDSNNVGDISDKEKNKENENVDNKNLENLAMEELDNIKKEEERNEVSFREEGKEEINEDEEFSDFDIANGDNQDFQNFNFNFSTTRKEDEIDVEIPNSLKESKLEFLLRYLFYFYFLLLAYFYKLDEKTKFVERFIEKSKRTVDDLILRIERMFAKLSPRLYNRIVKDSEILGTLVILAVLHYNFHVEVTRGTKSNRNPAPKVYGDPTKECEEVKESKKLKVF